jgi:taurine transport system substrate-binding protein
VRILNLGPPEIPAAWKRGWDPVLARLKASGKMLVTSKKGRSIRCPTLDASTGCSAFAAEHPDVVSVFARVTWQACAKYRRNPDARDAESPEVAKRVSRSATKTQC